jgi:hypothetical protein
VAATAISNVEDAEPPDGWSVQRGGKAPEVPASLLEIKKNNIFSDIDTQLLVPSEAAGALIVTQAHLGVTISDAAPPRIQELVVPLQDRRSVSHKPRSGRGLRLVSGIGALLLALGLGWFAGSLYWYSDRRDELTGRAAIDAVVERIIAVESNGDPNAKNSHSSATGLGQFLNDTWLDLIREYRPDLTKGRSESETLELRRETKLAREITADLSNGMLRC